MGVAGSLLIEGTKEKKVQKEKKEKKKKKKKNRKKKKRGGRRSVQIAVSMDIITCHQEGQKNKNKKEKVGNWHEVVLFRVVSAKNPVEFVIVHRWAQPAVPTARRATQWCSTTRFTRRRLQYIIYVV